MVTLRYAGGSLTFADSSGARRRIAGGEAFVVDAAMAKVLLEDPAVTRVDIEANASATKPAVPEATEAQEPAGAEPMTVKELRARADELGLTVKARATKAEIEAAIAAEEAGQAEVATEAQEPAGEGGETPSTTDDTTSSSGAITLDDIPPGGVVGTDPVPASDES